MRKWTEVRGINPAKYDALISAGCRYMNSTEYPSVEMLAAIIGLEEIQNVDPSNEQAAEMEDGE